MVFFPYHKPGKCLHQKHGQHFKRFLNGSKYVINSLFCIFWAISVLFTEQLKDTKTSASIYPQVEAVEIKTLPSLCDWSNQAPSCNGVDKLLIWTESPVMRACAKDMKFCSLRFRGETCTAWLLSHLRLLLEGEEKRKNSQMMGNPPPTHTHISLLLRYSVSGTCNTTRKWNLIKSNHAEPN